MKFNSDKILDECNVCGGDGSTCNAIEGIKKIIPDKGMFSFAFFQR